MLSRYVLNVKPYIQLLLCVYGIYFAAKYIFQRFIKSQRGFSNAGAGAGYTFYPHSPNLDLFYKSDLDFGRLLWK